MGKSGGGGSERKPLSKKDKPKRAPKTSGYSSSLWLVPAVAAVLLALLLAVPEAATPAKAGAGAAGPGGSTPVGADDGLSPEQRELFEAASAFFESDQQVRRIAPAER